jgi:hypothetical protein
LSGWQGDIDVEVMRMAEISTVQHKLPDADQRFVGHILLDVPAIEPVLGFQPMASALATLIQRSEPRFAVGIFGGWGCGKSTLLDAIESKISQDEAVVVKFNAWRYEREPHLMVPLLDTIRGSLAEWASEHQGRTGPQAASMAERIGKVVRALARGFSAAVGLPGIGSVSIDIEKAMDAMSPQSDEDVANAPQSLYFAAFQELSAAFAEIETANFSRIVVFVDDLDRCLPTSALTVLESMKLFFDMPGFVFVVGLDERVVERAVWSKFARDTPTAAPRVDFQIEHEYIKKIFQIPYTLPALAPGQLGELLAWMDKHGEMSEAQRGDLSNRVRHYLRYVAVEGRINPREIKRFVNAYTLQRMIRPDLHPGTVLALQTLDFRRDWEETSDLLLSEPDVFVDALRQYREGNSQAFENIWPELAVLPPELAAYLRSGEAEPLSEKKDLERYLFSLGSTSNTLPWLPRAIRDVGQLRQLLRDVAATARFGDEVAARIAEQLRAILDRLVGYQNLAADKWVRLDRYVQRLTELATRLTPPPDSSMKGTTPETLEGWKEQTQEIVDALHQELRLIRRSSAFGTH